MSNFLYHYSQDRTFFKDGVIWGRLTVQRATIIKGIYRFQWYPSFESIDDLDNFGAGYSTGLIEEYLYRHGRNPGIISWPDYHECRARLVSWYPEEATRPVFESKGTKEVT